MNPLLRLLPALLTGVALAATLVLAAPTEAAVVPAPVVLMPTVQVTASRALLNEAVVELPTVVVTGHRAAPAATRLAQRSPAPRT